MRPEHVVGVVRPDLVRAGRDHQPLTRERLRQRVPALRRPGGDIEFFITAPIEQLPELLGRDFVFSHFHQGSDDSADHPPKEVRSRNPELNDVFFRFESGTFDLDDRGLARARGVRSAEANKITPAGKHRRRFGHLLGIQLVFDPPYVSLDECLLSPGNLIQVDAR